MRLFFATDIHGSETCWRKFLNSGQHYEADVIVLGGDMTGKALVPVIHDGGERWHATLLENREELVGEDKVAAFEDAVIRRGYYPFRTTPEGVRENQWKSRDRTEYPASNSLRSCSRRAMTWTTSPCRSTCPSACTSAACRAAAR